MFRTRSAQPTCFAVTRWNVIYICIVVFMVIMSQGLCQANTEEKESQIRFEGENATDDVMSEDDFDLFEEDLQIERVSIKDPFQSVNRAIFKFNDSMYFRVIRPVAKGYKWVVPTPARKGVRNFFDNLEFPVRFVNCVLQLKAKGAGTELVRFSVNSTIGILGLMDPAEYFFHIEPRKETLGQTLGVYGIGNGFYLVLPFFGPSTLRDAIGLAGDSFLKPVTYITPYELSLAISSYKYLNAASLRIGDYEAMKEAAIDPYNAFKDAYLQYQKYRVAE